MKDRFQESLKVADHSNFSWVNYGFHNWCCSSLNNLAMAVYWNWPGLLLFAVYFSCMFEQENEILPEWIVDYETFKTWQNTFEACSLAVYQQSFNTHNIYIKYTLYTYIYIIYAIYTYIYIIYIIYSNTYISIHRLQYNLYRF